MPSLSQPIQFTWRLLLAASMGPLALIAASHAASPLHHSLLKELSQVQQRISARDGNSRSALFVERASIERRLGRLDAATASLRCATVWDGGSLGLAQERCRLLTARGSHARAAEVLGPWIDASPEDAASRLLRGQAHLAARAFESAALDFERSRDGDIKQFTVDAELWLAEAWAGAGHAETALTALDRATRDRGALPALIRAAIELELQASRFDAALQWHDKEKPVSGSTPSWHARRGDLLAVAGRLDEAREAWGAALRAHALLPARRRCTAAATRLHEQLNEKLAPSDAPSNGESLR